MDGKVVNVRNYLTLKVLVLKQKVQIPHTVKCLS